jgi:galactose mutarotase-like enzyme
MGFVIANDRVRLAVDARGAEPVSLQTVQDPLEFLWQGEARYWGRQAPVLFPIVGALKDNRYTFNGRTYEMGQHGFARDSRFEMIEATEGRLTFLLRETPESLKKFPFPFELYTTYTLQGRAVRIDRRVVNPGDGTLWFSIGEHPGFNCPLFAGEGLEDYYLEFDREESLERRFLENSLLTEKREPFLSGERTVTLSADLFKRGAVILGNCKSGAVSLKSRHHSRKVTVTLEGYPYLGIWSPAKGAPFVCLEPWQGIASPEESDGDLTRKPAMISLAPGKEFQCGYNIMVA